MYDSNKSVPALQPILLPVADEDETIVSRSLVLYRVRARHLKDYLFGAQSSVPGGPQSNDIVIIKRDSTLHSATLGNLLPGSSVKSAALQNFSVTDTKLSSDSSDDAKRAVSTNSIKTDAVVSRTILAGAVTAGKLGPEAVLPANIQVGAVGTSAIADQAVTALKFHDSVVTTDQGDATRTAYALNHQAAIPRTGWGQSQSASNWSNFRTLLEKTTNRNSSFAAYFRVETPALVFPGGTTPVSGGFGGAFSGGVLLPDGRIFLVPFNHPEAWIFDPKTGSHEKAALPSGGYPAGTFGYFVGGVLVPGADTPDGAPTGYSSTDGPKVLCIPFNSKRGMVYDPQTNGCSWTNEITTLPNAAFAGGVVMPRNTRTFGGNPAAVLIPNNSTTLYYMTRTSLANVNTAAGTGHVGGTLLSDGTVVFGDRKFDPSTQAQAIVSPVIYRHPTISQNGEVFSVTSAGEFRRGSTVIGSPPSPAANDNFSGLVRLSDNNFLAVPGRYSRACVVTANAVHPIEADFTNVTTGAGVARGRYSGGVLLPDGRVFLVPCCAPSAKIIGTRITCAPPSWDVLLSPYFNKF